MSSPMVDEAIKIIDESGVKYEVHPLETTMEGELSELFAVIEKMNVRMIEIGSPNVISQVKISISAKRNYDGYVNGEISGMIERGHLEEGAPFFLLLCIADSMGVSDSLIEG